MPNKNESSYPRSVGKEVPYITDYFTGIRPTGELTIANLVAIKPTLALQEKGPTSVFVADMHATTTHTIQTAQTHSRELVKDYLTMGIDPTKTNIYLQSSLYPETAMLTLALSRWVSVAELTRQPSLKDKVKDPTKASAALALYPVMMAADILLQDAHYIPVGDDQLAHVELTRVMVDRINNAHGSVLAKPIAYQDGNPPPRYLSLRGEGKMSKSNPEGAILLKDSSSEIRTKIRKAVTAFPGQASAPLTSHIALAKELSTDPVASETIDAIYAAHMNGEKVMGEFKSTFSQLVVDFTEKFHSERAQITDEFVNDTLTSGSRKAKSNAAQVIERLREANVMF